MQKKKWISGVIIAVIILLVLVAVWLFTTGMKPKDNEKELKDMGEDNPPIPTGGNSLPPPSVNPTTVKCTNDAFPLGVGSRNQCVVALQKALGISQDGIFGQQTKAAVNAKGYVVPLTHSDFDKIIGLNPASWQTGNPVYLKGFGASLDVYVQQSSLGMQRIGAINNYLSGSKKVGKYVGAAFLAGYSSIKLDQPINGITAVFVRTDAISKTA